LLIIIIKSDAPRPFGTVPVFGKETFSSSIGFGDTASTSNHHNNSCDTNHSVNGQSSDVTANSFANNNNNNNHNEPIMIEKRNERDEVVEVSPVRNVIYSKQTSVNGTAATTSENAFKNPFSSQNQPQSSQTLTPNQSSSNLVVKASLKASGPSTSTLPAKATLESVKPSLATASATLPSTSGLNKPKTAILTAVTRQNSSANLLQQQQVAVGSVKASEQVKEPAAATPVVSNTPKKQTQANLAGQPVLAQLLAPIPSKPTFNKIV
jgi:hypothetical protein